MTLQSGVQISGSAVADELSIRHVNAPYPVAGGSALEETAKALYVGEFRHGWLFSERLPRACVTGPSPQRGRIAVLSGCRDDEKRR